MQCAHFVPEAADIKTTLHGPGNRVPMCSRQAPESDADSDTENEAGDSSEPHAAAAAGDVTEERQTLPPEELNEHETVIGIDQESPPLPLRLFGAFRAKMDVLRAEAGKLAQAQMREQSREDATAAAAAAGAKQHVLRIAVDMAEIAKKMGKNDGGTLELEALAAI